MKETIQFVIDQSTSGTKLLVMKEGQITKRYDRSHQQIYPRTGWVEHDPLEIWQNVEELLEFALVDNQLLPTEISTLSITNQRETVIAWDKTTGKPFYNAIVWQCNRSGSICQELINQGKESQINEKTGLRLDPYFSGTKMKWLQDEISVVAEKSGTGELAMGTMDSWLIWNLTQGKVFATDASNACRTLLYNIEDNNWDTELIELFAMKLQDLPEVKASNAIFGTYKGIPIKGVMADSQAALLGEGCNQYGDVKITMGTGCSILMQVNQQHELRDQRILTTIAWEKEGNSVYALEGIIRSCGDAINWFSQNVASLTGTSERCNEVLRKTRKEQIYFIPALQGMGAPYWNNALTAGFFGMKRTTSHQDLLKAVLESLIFQIKAVVDVMEEVSGLLLHKVYVDGGVSKNQELMKLLATLLNKEIIVSEIEEFSAFGVAILANPTIATRKLVQTTIAPSPNQADIRLKYEKWKRLIEQLENVS